MKQHVERRGEGIKLRLMARRKDVELDTDIFTYLLTINY